MDLTFAKIPTSMPSGSTHPEVLNLLDAILENFGLCRKPTGSSVSLVGDIPARHETKSDRINLSLIGAVPALANAIAATQIFEARGGRTQTIEVDLRKSHNYLDPDTGMTPTLNGQEIPLNVIAGNPFISGIYETLDKRHVVPSAVYVDLVYKWSTLLGCAVNTTDVASAIKLWNASDLEAGAAEAGLPFAVIQSEEAWKATTHGQYMAELPVVPVRKATESTPKPLSSFPKRPLEGVKVICATHAIAGPSAARTLAEHGATVLQIMYTHGFEHDFVYTYANLGCASSRLNFNKTGDRQQMWRLIKDADVWIDSYREGALSKFGFTDDAMLETNPAISSLIHISTPQWPPGMVINDYTTGYFGALAIQATLLRRMREGGSYILSPSLTKTAMTIVKHFKSRHADILPSYTSSALPPDEIELDTGMGLLRTLKPLPVLDQTPIHYGGTVLEPMGSCLPVFPGDERSFNVHDVSFTKKEEVMEQTSEATEKQTHMLHDVGRRFRPKPSL